MPLRTHRVLVMDVCGMVAVRPTTSIAEHLLLVDDDVDMRELTASLLRDSGYDVEEAGDGVEALASIAHKRPLLLITDCNMPNMSGNELVARLAIDESLSSIPAIVISALEQPSLPANVLWFLVKPFTIHSLEVTIRHCLATASPDD